ncbi:polysaccharide deacetylase family protein [Bacillus coahuilensis]|uniref:polysaccharide deacetylase family protein n=1 Tax=Bacillus coahuilensis TaxID=408580 RepID=UPI0007506D5C|nr:polysaccharide deacetylase family protein [Bacillus coahuilensis]
MIPIYVISETGKEIQFKDSPRLVEVLQDLQDKGGSVILHGYTHQYRGDETGEGFEFWDVENNMPISGPADVPIEPLNPDNFSTKEEYEYERLKRVEFETDYVQTKVEKGIEELVSYGLYPVAFEAPHYTMSQNAYHIVGDYFSTYIGQLQLSDENWKIMQPSPYETSPSFLNGMKLLPETVGFVDPENPHVLVDIDRAIERQLVVRDGVVAGFYHSYLGVERFKEFLALLESTPNIQWIDLKSYRSVTAIDNVSIEVNEESGTLVHIDYLKAARDTPQLVDQLIQKITNNVLWFIVFIAGGMVCIFFFTAAVFHLRNSSQKGELR